MRRKFPLRLARFPLECRADAASLRGYALANNSDFHHGRDFDRLLQSAETKTNSHRLAGKIPEAL
jgi:hypothetical protein